MRCSSMPGIRGGDTPLPAASTSPGSCRPCRVAPPAALPGVRADGGRCSRRRIGCAADGAVHGLHRADGASHGAFVEDDEHWAVPACIWP
jgi:hypothetical protein